MSIIFLNGTTSSGKTSLAKSLQNALPQPYLLTGIDDAFAMLPDRLHNHRDGFYFDRDPDGLIRLNFGKVGLETLKSHQVMVAALASHGMNVICDEVVLTSELRADWFLALSGLPVFFVGVHCSLEELERREKARGDRMIGQARGQFTKVHVDMPYDLEIDTTNRPTEAVAREIMEAMKD